MVVVVVLVVVVEDDQLIEQPVGTFTYSPALVWQVDRALAGFSIPAQLARHSPRAATAIAKMGRRTVMRRLQTEAPQSGVALNSARARGAISARVARRDRHDHGPDHRGHGPGPDGHDHRDGRGPDPGTRA